MSNSPFQYKLENIIRYEITGDFRSGEALAAFKIMIEATALTGLKLQLDLFNVEYMDSDSYKLVHDLYKKDHLIHWDDSSYVWERYVDYVASKK